MSIKKDKKRKLLQARLKEESVLVATESYKVLKEFEKLDIFNKDENRLTVFEY